MAEGHIRTATRMAAVAAAAALALTACGVPSDRAGSSVPSGDAASPSLSASPAQSSSAESPAQASAEPSTATPSPTPSPSHTKTPTPSKQPKPAALLKAGDQGEQVRELQHRLLQLDWFGGTITGVYAEATTEAVSGFQVKRSMPGTGAVDQQTWDKLVAMTVEPTHDQKHNVLKAGPALLESGSSGERVRELQARMSQIGWHSGEVTGHYGPMTVANVKGFQGKRQIPVTGEVDQRTWDRLTAMTRTPTRDEMHNVKPKPKARPAGPGLDPRCLTGRAMCISKRTNQLVWVIDGKPQLQVDVRFGSDELPTREGAFSVGWKSRDHVSTLYDTPMPFAMFFSGGQAVHYSPDFAANGYAGASHGCVNVRDRAAVEHLFDVVRVGDKVIVYR